MQSGTTSVRQSREIALLSGPISVAWISSAGVEESSIPPVGITCGEDGLIKVHDSDSAIRVGKPIAYPEPFTTI